MSDEAGSGERRPRHPIRVVARRTGISLHVLRAWERRYGVVEPGRTGGGQRLYSDADIARLKLLRRAVEAGWPISQAAELDSGELQRLVEETLAVPALVGIRDGAAITPYPAEGVSANVAGVLKECLEAADRLDHEAVHRVLLRSVVSLRPQDFIDTVVGPLLLEVGERWHRGELSPAREHAVSVAVRSVLGFLLSAYEPEERAPVLLSTTLSGDPHEFGALLAGVVAAEYGWKVLYLGPSLPADEIASAAADAGAAAVAVSVVDDRSASELGRELRLLRSRLPGGMRLVVGGRGALAHHAVLAGIEGVELGGLELLRRPVSNPVGAEVVP